MSNLPTAMLGGMPIRVVPNGDGTFSLATTENPITSAAALTNGGGAVAGGRKFAATASVAGTVTVALSGGGSLTLSVPVGYTEWSYAVTQITAATATATYANLS